MTWSADNGGNLFKSGSRWWLRFDPEDFKNEQGAARNTRYEVPVSTTLTDLIESYLFEARPLLLDGKDDPGTAFVSSRGAAFDANGISNVVNKVACKYLNANLRTVRTLRGHAFRHIVATAWLRDNPGQFRTAALLLHDELETVLKNYDHPRPADGILAWEAFFGGRVSRPRVHD